MHTCRPAFQRTDDQMILIIHIGPRGPLHNRSYDIQTESNRWKFRPAPLNFCCLLVDRKLGQTHTTPSHSVPQSHTHTLPPKHTTPCLGFRQLDGSTSAGWDTRCAARKDCWGPRNRGGLPWLGPVFLPAPGCSTCWQQRRQPPESQLLSGTDPR